MKPLTTYQVPFFRYALFGSALAFAGPPVYIHVPKLYTEQHGISLAALATLLLLLRAVDFIQDPFLGWLAERFKNSIKIIAVILGALLCIGMLALFTPEIPISPEVWLCLSLLCVFTGFSGLQIIYYSTGVSLAVKPTLNDKEKTGHSKIASWREAGILLGICTACVVPTILGSFMDVKSGYFVYAAAFVIFLIITLFLMNQVWHIKIVRSDQKVSFSQLLKDPVLSRLLMVGFINTLPVGLTATLFLFYVTDRLQGSETQAGVMLLLFFLCAAIAAPLWGALAKKYGMKQVLLTGMILSIAAFSIAFPLGAGDTFTFYIVCALSGAALGADMTLLPAMLSERLEKVGAGISQTFGIWGFVNKATLAIGAAITLPILQMSGFTPGQENSENALYALSFMYAALPCLLKFIAVVTLYRTQLDIERKV